MNHSTLKASSGLQLPGRSHRRHILARKETCGYHHHVEEGRKEGINLFQRRMRHKQHAGFRELGIYSRIYEMITEFRVVSNYGLTLAPSCSYQASKSPSI